MIGDPIGAVINFFDCSDQNLMGIDYIYFKIIWLSIIPILYLFSV